MNLQKLSKRVAYILRHRPEEFGITLQQDGWCNVEELLSKLDRENAVDFCVLEHIVNSDSKGRYEFSQDRTKIRALYGHSTQININYQPAKPPQFLYHGTQEGSIDKILQNGILKMSRQYVHLSKDIQTATSVGSRHGKAVVLKVKSGQMYDDGYTFFSLNNGIWLTDEVKPQYIDFLNEKDNKND